MRNLKKVLSLVLALMMVLSLMVTASASFTDEADIDYKEAVAVLVAAGILEGRTDGSFAPDAALDRAAAAKILAYVMLGDDIAYIGKTATPFSDVAATHWASGYVTYCASEGVVTGLGDGTFLPGGNLKATAFAKMLLVALGFDGTYTGSNWEFNVKKDAAAAGLTAGMPATTMTLGSITREQAAQMAFNAMKYSATATAKGYAYADLPGEVFDSYLDAYLTAKTVFDAEFDAEKIYQVVDTSDSILSATFGIYAGTPGTDAWGNPEAKVWCTLVKGEEVEIYSEMLPATATFTSAVTDKALATALGIKEDAAKALNVTANGTLVNYYKVGVNAFAIVPVEYTAATVVFGKADDKGSVKYELYAGDSLLNTYVDYSDDAIKANKNLKDNVVLEGEIVDGAVVTYVQDNNGVGHIYPTTTIEGTVTRRADGVVTIGAAKYAVSSAYNSIASGAETYKPTGKADQYALDQYGYLVGLAADIEEQAPEYIPTQFVYLVKYQTKAYNSGVTNEDLFGSTTTGTVAAAAKAQVVYTDGTSAVVDLDIYKNAQDKNDKADYINLPGEDGKIAATKLTKDETVAVGTWYGYEVNEDGTYTLTNLNAKTAQVIGSDVTVKAGKTSTIAGLYTNSNTAITAITVKDEKLVTKNVSGLQSVDVTVKAGSLVVYAQNAKVVSAVYGFETITFGEAQEQEKEYVKPDYYYIVSNNGEVVGGVEYTVYVNETTTTKVLTNDVTVGGVYTLTENKNEKGELLGTYAAEAVVLADAGKVVLTDNTFFVTEADTYYYNTKGCEIYNVTKGTAGVEDVVEAGDYVKVLTGENGVTLIYIVDAPKAN